MWQVIQPGGVGRLTRLLWCEDMDEKSSMMVYSDIVVTVYSTMLVETAIHDTPMIAATIDIPVVGTRKRNSLYPSRRSVIGLRINASAMQERHESQPKKTNCAMR